MLRLTTLDTIRNNSSIKSQDRGPGACAKSAILVFSVDGFRGPYLASLSLECPAAEFFSFVRRPIRHRVFTRRVQAGKQQRHRCSISCYRDTCELRARPSGHPFLIAERAPGLFRQRAALRLCGWTGRLVTTCSLQTGSTAMRAAGPAGPAPLSDHPAGRHPAIGVGSGLRLCCHRSLCRQSALQRQERCHPAAIVWSELTRPRAPSTDIAKASSGRREGFGNMPVAIKDHQGDPNSHFRASAASRHAPFLQRRAPPQSDAPALSKDARRRDELSVATSSPDLAVIDD